MKHETREGWLNAVALEMAPWFKAESHPLPTVRMAVGFTSTGKRGRRIGECWTDTASADGAHEIFIRPDQDDALTVAAILAHELIHAAVGIAAKHGPKFRKVAVAIGLEGKMTATVPGEAFKQRIAPILEAAGPLPHARLSFAGSETTGPKKQSARLLKAECGACGYTVRVTRKWVDEAGAPHCPIHGPMDIEGV